MVAMRPVDGRQAYPPQKNYTHTPILQTLENWYEDKKTGLLAKAGFGLLNVSDISRAIPQTKTDLAKPENKVNIKIQLAVCLHNPMLSKYPAQCQY